VKDDQNGPELEGIGYAQWNINKHGRRVSAARALIDLGRSRPNLAIRTHTRVDKVIISEGRATGVACTADGQPLNLFAAREVILCAGALVSPKILQLSGIGDGAVLQAAGIQTIHNSPNVGMRMREHLTLAVNFRLRDWRYSDNREYAGVRLVGNMFNYLARGKGPMARGAAEAIAFVRAHPKSTRPDTQIMFNPFSLDTSANEIAFEKEPGMQCYSYMLRPESEGSALITSADPSSPLNIRPAYLETEIDQATSIAGTRAIRRIMEQDALRDYVVGETEASSWAQSDDEILALYKQSGHSGYHAVGTAAMGPSDTDVLDSRLRVRGVSGLRIVDCSIFREMPAGNTNAPAMAAAWRLAQLIAEDSR